MNGLQSVLWAARVACFLFAYFLLSWFSLLTSFYAFAHRLLPQSGLPYSHTQYFKQIWFYLSLRLQPNQQQLAFSLISHLHHCILLFKRFYDYHHHPYHDHQLYRQPNSGFASSMKSRLKVRLNTPKDLLFFFSPFISSLPWLLLQLLFLLLVALAYLLRS